MLVRSLTSSVFTWPRRDEVDRAARRWARELAEAQPNVLAVGYFGSYARNDYSVGSDLDLIVLLAESALPSERRALDWPLEDLPVPAEAVVFTLEEWGQRAKTSSRFCRVLKDETVWLYRSPRLLEA